MKTIRKIIVVILCIFLSSLFFIHHHHHSAKGVTRIGIILPIEHQALREIVAGFTNEIKNRYAKPVEIKVENAQGDPSLMRAIVTQMRDEHYDLLVPIATSTTQMTASLVQKQPVVGLAAEYPEKERKERKFCNIGIVDDEIDKRQIIAFIRTAYPQIKNMVIIYSAADKIFPEVAEIDIATRSYGINLHKLMVQNLMDLASVASAIPKDTQAIFILKDNLIASGISTLIKVAAERKIFLITSDDGTVREGASFAVGVHEREIGEEGARLASKLLNGIPACKLAAVKMTKPTIFINAQALARLKQDPINIERAARMLNYSVEIYGGSGHE